jgi:hypothetical protein
MKPVEAIREAYRQRWGEPTRRAAFRKGDLVAEVEKWSADANPDGVTLYATLGASRHGQSGGDPNHRCEFLLGLVPEKDDVASALAALALFPERERTRVDHGHIVPADGPLWSGTQMDAFLVMRPLEELVPTVSTGDAHIEVLQAIPIFPAEREALRTKPADELLQEWQSKGVAFWDPDRKAAP